MAKKARGIQIALNTLFLLKWKRFLSSGHTHTHVSRYTTTMAWYNSQQTTKRLTNFWLGSKFVGHLFFQNKKFAQDANRKKKKKNEVKTAGHRPVDKSMSLHGLYRASGQVRECLRFEFGYSIQTATVYIRTIGVYNSWLGCCAAAALGVCRKNDKEALRFVCSLLFSLLLFIATPFFDSILLFTRALWYFWTISKSLRQERRKELLTPPRPKKERGCCPSSAPGQLASSSGGRYIYTLVLKPARNRAGHVKWNVLLLRIDA